MAIVPVWFDANYYLNTKADQLNAIGYGGKSDWTAATTEAAFTEQNISVYDHFVAYGKAENISPNAMFNVAEYLASKAKQLNAESYEGKTDWTEASVMEAFNTAGISAWDHYTQFGMVEGINPSNQFDTSAYLDAKLADLVATEPTANWTMDSMLAAFKAGNVNPLEHYQLFGQAEGLTVPPVAPADKVVTGFDPYAPANDGTTYTLTTAADNFTGTEKNDVFNGVLSSVSAEGTLNNTDKMDGAAGTADTLNVNMKGDFRGFTTGSMTNVEKVNLTNDTSLSHSFSAKGVTGVDTWNLNAKGAAINLSDLSSAEGVSVNVLGQQRGTTTIGFDTKAVEGTNDSLTLGLNGVGTSTTKVVTVNAAEIENLHVKATGDNFVNLSAAAEDSITVNGTGNLNVTNVASTLTTFDANALSGSVNADLTAATGITTIKGGAGDDNFTIASLGAKAVIDGGDGEDTLTVDSVIDTLAATMSGIETVVIDGANAVTLVGKNVTGLNTVTLKNSASVTTSGLDAAALTLNIEGYNATTHSNATITETTVLTYNTVAKDGELINKVYGTVTAAKATAATVNIGQHTQTDTSLILSAAETVTLNVASSKDAAGIEDTSFTGIINAAKAQSLVVDAKGTLGMGTIGSGGVAEFNVATAKSVTVTAEQGGVATFTAGAATDVSITAGKGLNISTSTFGKAQNVTLVQNDGTLSGDVALGDLNVLTVSGDGKTSRVELGDLGGDTAQKHSLTINASGLKSGFDADTIKAGANDVALNFADVTGNVVLASVAGQNVVVNAAGMGTTKVTGAITGTGDVTINALGVLGGGKGVVGTDNYAFDSTSITAGTDKNITLNFDGNSDMNFGALSAAGKGTININAAGYLGNLGTTGTVNADAVFGLIKANTVNIKGAETGSNTFNGGSAITANTLTFTGGLDVDLVDMTGFAAGAMSATINTGIGIDEATIKAHGATTTITVSGDLGGDSVTPSGGVTTYDEITVTGGAKTTGIDIAGLAGYGKSTINSLLSTEATQTIKSGAGADGITVKAGAAAAFIVDLNTGAGLDKAAITASDTTTSITITGDMGGNSVTDGVATTYDSITVSGGAKTGTINIGGLTGYGTSIINSLTSDAATQTITSGDGADTINVTANTAAKALTVDLTTGAGKDIVKIAGVADTTDIKVTGNMGGNSGDEITVTGAAATKTVDLSLLSGYESSTITGVVVANSVITGGTGIDKITASALGGTITGNGGNDVITLNAASAVDKIVVGNVATNGIDDITNFAQGDVIVFTGATANAFTESKDATLTGAANIYAALAAITDTLLTKNSAIVFSLAGEAANSYAIIDSGAHAGYQADEDTVIHLIGVNSDAAGKLTATITDTVTP